MPLAWELASQDKEVETGYWTEFQPYGLGAGFHEVAEVARRLMRVGRFAGALNFIHLYSHSETQAPDPTHADLIVEGLRGLLGTEESDPEARELSQWDFEQLFGYLEAAKQHVGAEVVAQLQWAFLPALGYEADVPTLFRRLGENPDFFVEVICSVYRPRRETDNPGELDEARSEATQPARDERIAANAYQLLASWNYPPGEVEGAMDAEVLRSWLSDVRRLLDENGRSDVGLQHVGQVLGYTPPDEDGPWPGGVVRDLLEEMQHDDLDTGVYLQIVNGRGVTSRSVEEGGEQELEEAEKYQAISDQFADEAPRTAAIMRKVAESFRADARRNEANAERFRRGLH